MLFILAEKHNQERAYAKALKGHITHPNRYIDEVDNSKTLPKYPKIQLSYLQGHAYELKDAKQYDPKWKSWAYKYLPVFPKKFTHVLSPSFKKYSGGRAHVRAINNAIKDNHAKLWLGSDPDVEGEGLIYEYTDLNGLQKYIAGRIWITHGLTVPGLVKTFHNDILNPAKTRPRATASHAREAADWLIGINISRLATDIARKYGYRRGAFTAGRVQTPTLALITARRKARKQFKPSTSYRLAFLDKNGLNFTGSISGNNGKLTRAMFKTKSGAQQAGASLNSTPTISNVSNQTRHQSAPKLPKTNDMQGYIVKHAHISAQQAANKVLEPMYDSYNAQTYPRTECNLITTDDFNELKKKLPQYKHLYEQIIGKKLPDGLFTNLKPRRKYVDFTGKKVQKQGHGAITPNPENKVMSYAQYQKLSFPDKVDYKHVLGCTLGMFADDHAYQQLKVNAKSGKYTFKASNKSDLPNSTDWKQLFPWMKNKKSQTVPASDYKSGTQLAPNSRYTNNKGYYAKSETTKPPKAITESNLVQSVMPKYKLGTSSTRASIIASLKHTKLIKSAKRKVASKNLKKNEFMPTDKGIVCLELLKYSHLLNLAKVQSWQEQMDSIADRKVTYSDFVKGVKQDIQDDITKMPKHQYKFKIKPSNKPSKFSNIQKHATDVTCPKCKKHQLFLLTMDMAQNGKKIPIGFYVCPMKSCKFSVNENLSGLKITSGVLQKIIDGKLPWQNLTSKKGNSFKATFRYNRGKIVYKFPPHKHKNRFKKLYDITCPKCHKGKLGLIAGKSKKTGKPYALYACNNNSCKFHQFKHAFGTTLTPDIMKRICNGTMNQMQLTSRKGKPYQATPVYSRGKIKLKFNN